MMEMITVHQDFVMLPVMVQCQKSYLTELSLAYVDFLKTKMKHNYLNPFVLMKQAILWKNYSFSVEIFVDLNPTHK